jgi:uncharacterized membrane protein
MSDGIVCFKLPWMSGSLMVVEHLFVKCHLVGKVVNASFASLSIVSQFAILVCKSKSIRLMNRFSGSMVMFSLSLSSSGTKSGRRDSASDCIILCLGVCTSLMSNSDR